MTVKLNSQQGLKEYQQKLKLGLMGKSKKLNPMEKAKQNPKSLRSAINAFCYECCCEQRPEVKDCSAGDCPLHKHRPWQ